MGTQPPVEPAGGERWQGGYFTYFTETEEHFQRARGTALFLLSPLDWALIESWKNAGIPLEAVLRGIDVAFEKWRGRKKKFQSVNSLAYCTQAVMAEAQLMAGIVPAAMAKKADAPFSVEELRVYITQNAARLWDKPDPAFREVAASLEKIVADIDEHYADLEDLERRLTGLEEKLSAISRARQTDDGLLALRRELDQQLKPYRGKMTAEQLSMLERQYLDRRILESEALPRLSLFYL